MKFLRSHRRSLSLLAIAAGALLAGGAQGLLGVCGPFSDVAADAFCPFVFEVFTLGITTGTSPTTYDPSSNVTRLQMAAFLSRTVDSVLKRGSRRAALNQFWTPQNDAVLDVTTVGAGVHFPVSDGLDVWVPALFDNAVSRVRASDGSVLGTWTGAATAQAALAAIGKIFVTGYLSPGRLYRIDPRQPAGAVTTVASNLGNFSYVPTFDGARIWTANQGPPASVSIVTPGASIPWTVTTVTAGFSSPVAALFDGSNVWVSDGGLGALLKLDSGAAVLQTVTLGTAPGFPVFDGANIWAPSFFTNSVSVVRRSNGAILATLTGNGLNGPLQASFDGERVLVCNPNGSSVSLFKAADLTPIGTFATGSSSSPSAACSDGVNFWIAFRSNQIARF